MHKLYYKVSFDILKPTIILLSILSLSLTNLTHAQSWTKLSPNPDSLYGFPTTRTAHTAVYDNANNRMIIFGGWDGGNLLNDLWLLTTANGLGGTPVWAKLSPTGSIPTTRDGHTAVYDSTNNRMIIFGGVKYGGYPYDNLNDVWVLSNSNGLDSTTPAWTQLAPSGSTPKIRYGHTTVYDPNNNRMIIFGGDSHGEGFLNDVWVLSNANGLDSTTSAWTQLFPTGSSPTTRYNHTAVYDTANNRMTIFGGYNNETYLNDVWVLSPADVSVENWMLYESPMDNFRLHRK